MNKVRIVSLLLAVILIAGGFVNSSMAVVSSNDYTEEELDSSVYDLRKYTEFFWDGNIVYNEVIYPIRGENNAPKYYYELMYDATEIISVKDYRLEKEYEQGVDYHLVDGNVFIPADSVIPRVDYGYIHPADAPLDYDKEEIMPYYPHADGDGYEYWVGGSDICDKSLVVTYIHNGDWTAPKPETQESALPNTMKKLTNREDMTIVVCGDSVSTGAMGSGFLGISPFADAYPEMTGKALREKFGYDGITLVNSAIGGTMSHFDETKMNNTVIRYSPDLVILNFGMNDSSCDRVGIPAEEFYNNHVQQIEYIKEKLPECEILLVSSLYGNRYTFPAERYEEHAAELHKLAAKYEGVGVTDPQAIEKYLIEETGKDFLCFMADNMVHPNDFGMRLTSQCILAALDVTDMDSYKDSLVNKVTTQADPDSHVSDGKKDELLDRIDALKKEIKSMEDEWDVNEAVNVAFDDVNAIIKRCDFKDHIFEHSLVPATCKESGHTHSVCTVCGFEYDHSVTAPIGGEHIMDEGRVTTSATYKSSGIYTYTCAKCGYEEHDEIPVKSNAPTLATKGMLHVNKSYNYMQGDYQPYRQGSGFIEMDVCPLDIDVGGTPYIGVWFSGYAITACYNFRTQQVEIINTSLPYAGGTPYAYKKVEWTPDSGDFKYNWKKFAVNVEGQTVRIYLDGELMLEHTSELYRATTEVALVYSVGEYYLDNFKIAGPGYDPVTGEGDYLGYFDFDTQDSVNDFWNNWGNSYSDIRNVRATAENYSTGTYKNHAHVVTYLNTVERTCNGQGYNEYSCDICGKVLRLDVKDPLYAEGHTLIDKYLMMAPTDIYTGYYGYSCENCFSSFKEKIPVGSAYFPVLQGDLNGDGTLDHVDFEYMRRYFSGLDVSFDFDAFDVNNDEILNNLDGSIIHRDNCEHIELAS